MLAARLSTLLSSTVLVTGCLLDPYCGVAGREIELRAQISPEGTARLERMDVEVGQSERDRSVISGHWSLTGVDLQFHVRALRIVVGATDSVLAELPVPAFDLSGSIPDIHLPSAAAADDLYELFLRGDAAVEILTDIPGRERIARDLVLLGGSGWMRPRCD